MAATDSSTALQPAPTKTHSQEVTGNRQETDSATSTAETDIRGKRDSHSRSRQELEREPSHSSVDSDKIRRKEGHNIGKILDKELFPFEAPLAPMHSYEEVFLPPFSETPQADPMNDARRHDPSAFSPPHFSARRRSRSRSRQELEREPRRDSYYRPRREPEPLPRRDSVDSDKFRRKEVRKIGEIVKTECTAEQRSEIRDALREAAADDRNRVHLRGWPTHAPYPPTTSSGQSTRQYNMWSSPPSSSGRLDSHGDSLDTMEVDGLDRVLEDHSFAKYPAVDTFQPIAHWPAVTCSELGSKRIRLVKIIPGPPGSIIEFEVNTCFLDQAPSYTAISYTWGSPSGFQEILVRSQLNSVPKNLWRFLDQARRLRCLDSLTGWLWIDALSIDQLDPLEKLEQVGVISSIFGNAGRVIIWLGPAYGNSGLALAALRPDRTNRTRKASRTLANPVWSAVHGLCERPYWRRLWVYQELGSAVCAELMCGSRLVSLQTFQEFLFHTAGTRCEDKFEILRESSAGKMLKMKDHHANVSLWSLIQKTSHLRCVDPRDKAYAVLSLARFEEEGIEADYTVTVPVLLNRVLETMHNSTSFEYPRSLRQVAKQCTELERLFGEPLNSMFVTEGIMEYSQHINPLEQLTRQGPRPDLQLQQRLSEWCDFYSHKGVRRLVVPPRTSTATEASTERLRKRR
jgi:hypothetical protein